MSRALVIALAIPVVTLVSVPAHADDLPSCEAVSQAYVDERGMTPSNDPADLQVSDFASILNRGSYLEPCQVPMTTGVEICAAVQKGKVAGITVHAHPADGALEKCVADAVVGLSFPDHPRMDVVRTKFAPQPKEEATTETSNSDTTAEGDNVDGPPKVAPRKGGCGCAIAPAEGAMANGIAIACAIAIGFARRAARTRSAALARGPRN